MLAGVVYKLGRLEAERMEEAGHGWEMAFYLSPLVFLAVEVVLLTRVAIAVVGFVVGPGCRRRAQAAVASAVCIACYAVVP